MGLYWVHPRETWVITGLLSMLRTMQATVYMGHIGPRSISCLHLHPLCPEQRPLFPEDLSLILCFQYLNTVIGLSPDPGLGDC